MSTPIPKSPADLSGRHTVIPAEEIEAIRREVHEWFFDDYLPRWVAASSGKSGEGPEFILEYWGTPMYVTGLGVAFWCLTDTDVLAFLEANQSSLRDAGYDHTFVPDRQINVYNTVGAAVEVIWSRRTADETEIQRWATHFEVAKMDNRWRVVGVQGAHTDANTLAESWSHGHAPQEPTDG